MTTKERLYIYDTTLRDGQQTQGVTFSLDDKLRISQLLENIGIDYIEGGWPGANPVDSEFFDTKKEFTNDISKCKYLLNLEQNELIFQKWVKHTPGKQRHHPKGGFREMREIRRFQAICDLRGKDFRKSNGVEHSKRNIKISISSRRNGHFER